MLGVDGGINTMAAAQATCAQGSGSRLEKGRIVRWAASLCACFSAEALYAASCVNTAHHASVRELGPQIKNDPGIGGRTLLDFWLPGNGENKCRAEGTSAELA